jgi:ABC-type Fe3+/spermidine/putrescine transport system ATPase subunit
MLELRNIEKSYEGKPLLRSVSLQIGEGETVCLLGPSGGGKSTLLRIVAGLEPPDRGEVLWNGEPITRKPAHLRGFGLMFQEYALFPHLDVAENVAFGLRMKKLSSDRIRSEVHGALAQVNLAGFERRRVADLSGGEQQRVALARALAPQPGLLMLDEPLGALDRALREELTEEIRRVLKSLRTPSLYVTHDQEEAFAVAARVGILQAGRIEQMGSPEELVARPGSAWIAEFLGLGNILSGRVFSRSPLQIKTRLGVFPADDLERSPAVGTQGWILLRPGGGEFLRRTKAVFKGIRGVVRESTRREQDYRILFAVNGSADLVCSSAKPFRDGEELWWIPSRGTWIGEKSEGRPKKAARV